MATVAERVTTLETAALTFVSRTQIQAMVDALGTDHSTLQIDIAAILATQLLLLDEVQSLKDRVATLEAA